MTDDEAFHSIRPPIVPPHTRDLEDVWKFSSCSLFSRLPLLGPPIVSPRRGNASPGRVRGRCVPQMPHSQIPPAAAVFNAGSKPATLASEPRGVDQPRHTSPPNQKVPSPARSLARPSIVKSETGCKMGGTTFWRTVRRWGGGKPPTSCRGLLNPSMFAS